jgi:heme/copper-type cytochrome/quinol oxidase subunit 3
MNGFKSVSTTKKMKNNSSILLWVFIIALFCIFIYAIMCYKLFSNSRDILNRVQDLESNINNSNNSILTVETIVIH